MNRKAGWKVFIVPPILKGFLQRRAPDGLLLGKEGAGRAGGAGFSLAKLGPFSYASNVRLLGAKNKIEIWIDGGCFREENGRALIDVKAHRHLALSVLR